MRTVVAMQGMQMRMLWTDGTDDVMANGSWIIVQPQADDHCGSKMVDHRSIWSPLGPVINIYRSEMMILNASPLQPEAGV